MLNSDSVHLDEAPRCKHNTRKCLSFAPVREGPPASANSRPHSTQTSWVADFPPKFQVRTSNNPSAITSKTEPPGSHVWERWYCKPTQVSRPNTWMTSLLRPLLHPITHSSQFRPSYLSSLSQLQPLLSPPTASPQIKTIASHLDWGNLLLNCLLASGAAPPPKPGCRLRPAHSPLRARACIRVRERTGEQPVTGKGETKNCEKQWEGGVGWAFALSGF